MEINNKTHICFDDGGLIKTNPDNSGFKIEFKVYDRILELAKRNEIKIPIACVASFFDLDKVFNKSNVNLDSERILNLIVGNKDYLELWNHGLTHCYNNEYTEFWSYSDGSVNQEIQEEKLNLSQQIFNKLGFYPDTFVPPGHAWEQDVTDLIASKYGLKNIAIREFEKTSFKDWIKNPLNRYKKQWSKSKYLNTFFRLGLGIAHDQTLFNQNVYKKSRLYIKNSFPTTIISNRKIRLKYPVDHYFAHIQNLTGNQSLDYFNFAIKEIKKT